MKKELANKYLKSNSKMYIIIISAIIILKSSIVLAQNTDSSDKIDIKKIEDQYWGAKDDNYSVIQNRTYTKNRKLFLSTTYGTLVNDPFAEAKLTSLAAGYFLTEDWGIELNTTSYNTSKNSSVSKFKSLGATLSPDYNLIRKSWTLSALYTPLYAKMTFMNQKILYFDMGLSLGMGQTSYDQVQQDENDTSKENMISQKANHYELGFMQQIFINQYFSFRMDLKNTFYKQKVIPYRQSSITENSSTQKSSNDTTISFGLTFFTK